MSKTRRPSDPAPKGLDLDKTYATDRYFYCTVTFQDFHLKPGEKFNSFGLPFRGERMSEAFPSKEARQRAFKDQLEDIQVRAQNWKR